MAERTLRGARLGGQSFEDERGIEFAARQRVAYVCAQGHDFEIPMAAEAEVPSLWECPRCGAEALRRDGERPEPKAEKPARTHWDMLLERRSPSSKRSSPSGSSCSAAARSARRTCTAPRSRSLPDAHSSSSTSPRITSV
jgi:hypothetical protein